MLPLPSEQSRRAGSSSVVRISIAELGRRFGVSCPRVVRVLDEAADASLIERSGRDGLEIKVLPHLRSVTEDFYVSAFLLCDHYLLMALDQLNRA